MADIVAKQGQDILLGTMIGSWTKHMVDHENSYKVFPHLHRNSHMNHIIPVRTVSLSLSSICAIHLESNRYEQGRVKHILTRPQQSWINTDRYKMIALTLDM